jgi:hypothetical protein
MSGSVASQADAGLVQLAQRATINQNGVTAVSATLPIPQGSAILNFDVDVLTAFNSATSAILTIGTAAAGTQYVTSVDCKTAAGRITLTYTAAQLSAMNSVGANTNVVATLTPVGATSAGQVVVTMRYLQTLQPTAGIL